MSTSYETHEQCLAYLFALHHRETACAKCKRRGAFHKHPTKPCYTCNCGQTHIYPQQGTIFRRSHVELPVWFGALRFYHKSAGICTARSMQKKLGVSYRTAWRMLHIVRSVAGTMNLQTTSFDAFLRHCLATTRER